MSMAALTMDVEYFSTKIWDKLSNAHLKDFGFHGPLTDAGKVLLCHKLRLVVPRLPLFFLTEMFHKQFLKDLVVDRCLLDDGLGQELGQVAPCLSYQSGC